MPEWLSIIMLTSIAGVAIPTGAWLAKVEHIPNRWLEHDLHHFIIAFGGGALLSAVALVLVPAGIHTLDSMAHVAFFFMAGAIFFMLLDILLAALNSPMSQLVAMLSDFVPEALALGAAFAVNSASAVLLAILITLQNLPEGFNAYHELCDSNKNRSGSILKLFCFFALLGPITGLTGYFLLSDAPQTVAAIMLFAAGGILYLIFQDIAPEAKLEHHWIPSLGAVAGFLLGIIGKMLIHH